jgi:hypothetical protein
VSTKLTVTLSGDAERVLRGAKRVGLSDSQVVSRGLKLFQLAFETKTLALVNKGGFVEQLLAVTEPDDEMRISAERMNLEKLKQGGAIHIYPLAERKESNIPTDIKQYLTDLVGLYDDIESKSHVLSNTMNALIERFEKTIAEHHRLRDLIDRKE